MINSKPSPSSYNLEPVISPRLVGRKLIFFAFILRVPVIGNFILNLLKKKNKVREIVEFASGLSEFPLYYPIHEMSEEEKKEHETMIEKSPLVIADLASAQKDMLQVSDDEAFFRHWTIHDYTRRYSDGDVTPTQVIDSLIDIVEQLNKRNPIIIAMNKKELRMLAAASTERYAKGQPTGVLDGVPIVIKDEVPTVGFPARFGTSFISESVKEDEMPVANLLREGALLVGKTNQHEIGLGVTGSNVLYGPARNPYNERYYTGGSSSGSAAAVAIGLVPVALGTDGGGSIRIPAGLCGVVGLKPTFKRVAIDCNLAPSLVHLGPIAGSVSDAALAYSIMAGSAPADFRHQSRKQPPVHLYNFTNPSNSLEGLRVGVFWAHIEDAEENIVKETKRAIAFFKSKGATVVDIELPHLHEVHRAHAVTILSEMVLNMDKYNQSDFQGETQASLAFGGSFNAKEFLAAQKIRAYAMRQVEELFHNKVDIIVSPATASIAPEIKADTLTHGESNMEGTAYLMRYIIHGNMTGIPGIVFPVGYDVDTGLPISVQVQAAHWREDLLLRVARVAEGLLPKGWSKPSTYIDVLGSVENTTST